MANALQRIKEICLEFVSAPKAALQQRETFFE